MRALRHPAKMPGRLKPRMETVYLQLEVVLLASFMESWNMVHSSRNYIQGICIGKMENIFRPNLSKSTVLFAGICSNLLVQVWLAGHSRSL